MGKEVDLNLLWNRPSPKGSDQISTLVFKDARDIIIRKDDKTIRYGPLRSVIIDPQRSRYILIFESEHNADSRNRLAILTKGVDELLFWPREIPSDIE